MTAVRRVLAALAARWNRLPVTVRDLLRRGLHSGWQGAVVLLLPAALTVLRQQSFVGVSVPWLGIALAAGVAIATSWISSFLSWRVPMLPPWVDAVIRAAKTTGQVYLGTLTATGIDLLHFDWGAMLTAGLVAGGLAFLRSAIAIMGLGGADSLKAVARSVRTGDYLTAAAVGDGTTVTADSLHGPPPDPRPDSSTLADGTPTFGETPVDTIETADDDAHRAEHRAPEDI